MKKIFLLFTILIFSGCSATKYQEMSITGGVKAQQITANSYRILARGNGYTDPTAIKDFALLKAAETTKHAGMTHFQIVNADDASKSESYSTTASSTTSLIGNTAYTTHNPGSRYNINKPGQDLYIRVLKLDQSKKLPENTFFADEIIKYVGSRIKRNNKTS